MQPHIRRSQLVIAVLTAAVALTTPAGRADTMFWINDSDSNAGPPGIGVLNPRGGTGYIWGRPDDDETLVNLSLNLVSDSAAIELASVSVLNPVIASPWSLWSVGNANTPQKTAHGVPAHPCPRRPEDHRTTATGVAVQERPGALPRIRWAAQCFASNSFARNWMG